jgi:hypothetical protein
MTQTYTSQLPPPPRVVLDTQIDVDEAGPEESR